MLLAVLAAGAAMAAKAIVTNSNMSFGRFVAAGTGAVLLTGALPGAARFNITGDPSTTYSITHSGSAALTSGPSSMALTKFSDLTAANAVAGVANAGVLSAAGTQSLYVGGTLVVAAAQAPGVYTGTVVATVEYN